MALCVPEMCFWPAKTRKILEVFEMHTCPWPGARIWFRHKRKKLVTASLLLHCIDGYSCLRYWNELFTAVFQVLDWNFLVLHFDGNVCNWNPKVIWPRKDWFWIFCWKMASFVDLLTVWTEICKNCSIVIFFDDMKFFQCLVWEVFWFVFWKRLYFLAIGVCNIEWWAFAMHCNFIYYVCASSLLALPQVMIDFRQDCITCERR